MVEGKPPVEGKSRREIAVPKTVGLIFVVLGLLTTALFVADDEAGHHANELAMADKSVELAAMSGSTNEGGLAGQRLQSEAGGQVDSAAEASRQSPSDASHTSSTGPTSSTSSTTTAPGRSEVTLAFAGDILPHMPLNRVAAQYGARVGKAYDFLPMLAPMKPVLDSVDVAICHMEVPLHPEGESPSGYPSFGAPADLVVGIRDAGYDGCSTGSNHSLDRGRRGIQRLLDTFDFMGLKHNGSARNPEEGDGRATIYQIDDVKVAHLSWAYGFNGYRIPEDAPWAVNQIDPNRIKARAAEARADGADLVVVSLHWGTEYEHNPTAQQERWAQEITVSPDVDLVIGHHAHVVQPVSKVNDKYVVWGLGNQLSNQKRPATRDGLTVRVHALAGPDGRWLVNRIEAIPTYVQNGTFRVLPIVPSLSSGTESASTNSELRASYARTAAVLSRRPTPGVELAPLP